MVVSQRSSILKTCQSEVTHTYNELFLYSSSSSGHRHEHICCMTLNRSLKKASSSIVQLARECSKSNRGCSTKAFFQCSMRVSTEHAPMACNMVLLPVGIVFRSRSSFGLSSLLGLPLRGRIGLKWETIVSAFSLIRRSSVA